MIVKMIFLNFSKDPNDLTKDLAYNSFDIKKLGP